MGYELIRNLLFRLDAEQSHTFTLTTLQYLHTLRLLRPKRLLSTPRTVMQLSFPNQVGLGAGLDKNGDYIDALAALGFGFIEIGTITPQPQIGNPKPRLFRLPESEALINRMGFNNKGVDYLINKVKHSKYSGILGINIGKNATTPIENAVDDYIFCMQRVYSYASYITINISSPNTVGLRTLQSESYLKPLLSALKSQQQQLNLIHKKYVPLVIKISPDLSDEEIGMIAKESLEHNIDGIIATNSTVSRENLPTSALTSEQGGLSGRPLFHKSLHVVTKLQQFTQGKIPIIAVGGILNAKDAAQMFQAGASLVQIYTGFIYRGPKLIQEIVAAQNNKM